MKTLTDVGFAFLIAFLMVLAFDLMYKFSLNLFGSPSTPILNAFLLFLVTLVTPVVTIGLNPIRFFYLTLLVAVFVLIFKYMPTRYRKYGLAAALTGWVTYGGFSILLFE